MKFNSIIVGENKTYTITLTCRLIAMSLMDNDQYVVFYGNKEDQQYIKSLPEERLDRVIFVTPPKNDDEYFSYLEPLGPRILMNKIIDIRSRCKLSVFISSCTEEFSQFLQRAMKWWDDVAIHIAIPSISELPSLEIEYDLDFFDLRAIFIHEYHALYTSLKRFIGHPSLPPIQKSSIVGIYYDEILRYVDIARPADTNLADQISQIEQVMQVIGNQEKPRAWEKGLVPLHKLFNATASFYDDEDGDQCLLFDRQKSRAFRFAEVWQTSCHVDPGGCTMLSVPSPLSDWPFSRLGSVIHDWPVGHWWRNSDLQDLFV